MKTSFLTHRTLFFALLLICVTTGMVFAGVCTYCNGSGSGNIQCSTCNGTGAFNGFKCASCNGRRFLKCTYCNGTGQR